MNNPDEPDRLRQSERTVDNLKRLYAVLFAASFTVLAAGTVAKINTGLTDTSFDYRLIFLHAEVTIGYALTAGLFYYQSDRFLDISLASNPLPDTSAFGFAFSYAVNVFTMAPFYFMAFALGTSSQTNIGFTLYFFGYLALIINGLFWLYLGTILRSVFKHKVAATEIESLNRFWMIMNSIMLFIVTLLFAHFSSTVGYCVAGKTQTASGFVFVFFLGIVIFFRDALDYWHGWPILYPIKDPDNQIRNRPILSWLNKSARLRTAAFWVAIGLTALSLFLLAQTGTLNIPAVVRSCSH